MRPSAALILGWLLALPAAAMPDFASRRTVGELELYRDSEAEHRFYYAPAPIELARKADGAPDAQLLQLRYVDDASGTLEFLSTLTLRVRSDEPDPRSLVRARKLLEGFGRVELRPLPVTRFVSQIQLPGAGADGGDLALPGSLESEPGRGRGGTLDERITIDLDTPTSILVSKLAQSGGMVLSVNYRFESTGLGDPAAEVEVTSEGVADAEAPPLLDAPDTERSVQERTVRAGAVELALDARRWPGLLHRVDFDGQAPPRYARLRVYCYAFREPAPASDLSFRKVEAEAIGADGSVVDAELKFSANEPTVYAKTLRFDRPVRVDRPFRFRVTDAHRDGRREVGRWRDRRSWASILDVSAVAGEP